MKKLVHVCLLCLFICLVVLGLPRLIVGPENTQEAARKSAPNPSMFMAVLPENSAAGPEECAAEQHTEHRVAAAETSHPKEKAASASALTADANGSPVISQVYIRTIYQAFPPESLYG